MAKLHILISIVLSSLFVSTTFVSSARILDETTPPIPTDTPDSSDPAPEPTNPTVAPTVPPTNTIPTVGPLPDPTTNVAPTAPTEPTGPTDPVLSLTPALAPVVPPVSDAPTDTPTTTTTPETTTPTTTTTPATTTPTTTTTTGVASTTATGATTSDHVISFFMHDIIGGSHPSGRVVTGVVTSTDAAQNLPFSKPNNQVFPINGGVPLNTINGVINNNNYPFLVGLNGSPGSTGTGTTLAQTNGNSVPANNNNQAFVTAGQLPQGVTLQQLMFGSVTVVDNEVTEGHELGTAVLGRAQGFYIVSSTDGTSHTLALTVLFEHHGGEETDDSVSFFGIHRTATPVSHVAVVGGTGKYENAKGYATIETMPHEDQHTTDGVETITHVTIYLTP